MMQGWTGFLKSLEVIFYCASPYSVLPSFRGLARSDTINQVADYAKGPNGDDLMKG